MNEIKFSWIWSIYNARAYARDGHVTTELSVVPIKRMHQFSQKEWNDGYKNRIQMSTYDRRVVKDTSYEYWNGCIFIDIDYKKWVADNMQNIINPQTMLDEVFTYMQEHYTDNLYYAELSRSGLGYHFIFYYNCKRTRENFTRCNMYTMRIVEASFEECGYYDIIHYKGVFDDCSKSFCQCCYLTRNSERFNERCTGKLVKYDNIVIERSVEHATRKINAQKWNYKVISKNENINEVEYIDHYERWRLFESLSMLYKDDLQLRNEWERCAKMMQEKNGHTTDYYIDMPYIGDWYRNLKGDEYIDTKLLSVFGYNVQITPKPVILYEDLVKLVDKLNINK